MLFLAVLFRQKYDADNRYVCLRMGVFLDESSHKGYPSVRQVVDGSDFDFGADTNGTMPKCGSKPGYPWCPYNPDCAGNQTSLVLMAWIWYNRYCWDDSSLKSCSVICKRKLN